MDRFREYGKTGLFRFNTGWIYEEFLRELQGRKGIEVYKEMSENDDVIGAVLFATEMLMRQSKWSIQEAGTERADMDAAEFVHSCMDDMEETWSDFISEVLTFLTYGWSYHEIVYKRRMGNTRNPETKSKYTDGLIGWRKLPIRSQDTLWEWKYDEKDNLIGLVQCAPPMYEQVFIPIEKALHFKTKSRKGNPEGRSILRNSYRCFDEETEILTYSGWMKGVNLTGSEKLVTLNPKTMALEYQTPSKIHKYQHDGDLIHFNSKFLDIAVTGGHRMWVQKHENAPFSFVEAIHVKKSHRFMRYADWVGKEQQTFTLPELYVEQVFNGGTIGQRKISEAANLPMDDWLAFLALFLTEGNTYKSRRGQKIVTISQKEGKKANEMRKLFARLPFHYYEHRQNDKDVICFEFSNAQLYREFKPFGKDKDKSIPQYVKQLTARQIGIFLEWYAFGDGMQTGNTAHGYDGTTVLGTISKTMADDLQELALKAGFEGQINVDTKRTTSLGKNPFYKVSLCKRRGHKAKEITHREYHGMVWCPTTQNGIVYVRRNGKPAWVGNCWYFKRRIQEIEGIGIERDLAGLPVLEAPEGVDIWSNEYKEELEKAESIVRSVRRDEREGIVLGNGWKFTLTSTGGRRQFDTNQIIERYDTRMAMTVLADFVLLGHQKVGSFALSSDKTEMFSIAMGAFLDLICEVFNNQAIPRLIDINGKRFAGITDYPQLVHGDIETQDLGQLGDFVSKMVGIGAITPDEGMEDYLRMAATLPERDFDTGYSTQGMPNAKNEQDLKALLDRLDEAQAAGIKGTPDQRDANRKKPKQGETAAGDGPMPEEWT